MMGVRFSAWISITLGVVPADSPGLDYGVLNITTCHCEEGALPDEAIFPLEIEIASSLRSSQ
jgi:hypothetical protein